jgi:tRNA A-37 threonylcarbamoyl transferase component Bud32
MDRVGPSPRGLRLLTRSGHPDFLDLSWDEPLDTWKGGRLVEVARGLHRHVVRFADYDGALYALKELPPRIAEREYRILRRMAEEGLPVVEAVGVAGRVGMSANGPLEDVLITRYLDYSLPYRTLFMHRRAERPDVRGLSDRLLDALAMLLARMHHTGFYWGDCSLSNTLFRRDAGALAAYIVDVETGEWHAQLTDGQRETDLEITELNIAGGLLDLQAELELPPDPDPLEMAEDLRRRYDRLWHELTTEETILPGERYKIEARIRRLNQLGFDVDEIEFVSADGGERLLLRMQVTEQGYHRRRLLSLTGLEAQENQARSLLNDLANFRASREQATGRPLPEQVAAYQWLSQVFEPAVAAIPEEQRGKLEPVEVFHEIIEHKWFLSEAAGRDVGVAEAVASYMRSVLPGAPEERLVLVHEPEASSGWMGYG